ncbi:MAG: hypothetical protein R2749_17945 [Acidimicrobiales bacterium]
MSRASDARCGGAAWAKSACARWAHVHRQRQRVKLAAAIAHDPRLLLLDEPTDGLDPPQRDAMLALIRRIGHDFGIDVVLSSHLLDEVERTCDNVMILADGRIIAAGPPAELRRGASGVVVELEHLGVRPWRPRCGKAGWTVRIEGLRSRVAADPTHEDGRLRRRAAARSPAAPCRSGGYTRAGRRSKRCSWGRRHEHRRPPPPPAGSDPGAARIIDQGYRRYDGERRGIGGAVRAVHKAAVQRALGLKRRPASRWCRWPPPCCRSCRPSCSLAQRRCCPRSSVTSSPSATPTTTATSPPPSCCSCRS